MIVKRMAMSTRDLPMAARWEQEGCDNFDKIYQSIIPHGGDAAPGVEKEVWLLRGR